MPSQCGLSAQGRAVSLCVLLGVLFYAAIVQAACGCFGCLSGAPCALKTAPDGDAFTTSALSDETLIDYGGRDAELEGGIAAFRIATRWGRTANHNATLFGSPVTLTWGFAPDGTTLPSELQEDGSFRRDRSDLIAFLDRWVGNSVINNATTNLQNKSWFPIVKDAYDRWSELSGVTFEYEPNDDGVSISGSSSSSRWGVLGVRADMRVSGHFIDGQSGPNTLAYNWFPAGGDMVIDTANTSFYSNSWNNYLRLRNVLMHEIGHGLGFLHLESNNSSHLMEPFISVGFDGPQIDDILAAHRSYGDVHEKNGGNDSYSTAIEVGELSDSETWTIGAEGAAIAVLPSMTDFISIDGITDTDYFHFRVEEPSMVDVTMLQVGRTYNEGPQGGEQTPLDTSMLNELDLALEALDGSGGLLTLATGAEGPRLGQEIRRVVVLPNQDYYVRVDGSQNNVQLYRLDLAVTALPVPEPASLLLATLAGSAAIATRRAA